MGKRKKKAALSSSAWQAANPLRRWREARPPEGWSRSLLARQLKVSHTAVASWETGAKLPMVDAFARIEKLTGITATKWMEWHEKKRQEARA